MTLLWGILEPGNLSHATAMIVDFHTHIVPPFLKEQREESLARDATLAALFADPASPMATAEELIAAMDDAGIDRAVVLGMGWTDRTLARQVNDYLLESASRYRDRLIPFCSVNPAWGDEAVREAERCARLGARGIGELHPDTQGFDLTSPEVMGPIMETVRQQGMLLLTHSSEPVGHRYPGKGATTPDVLLGLIQRYPDIPIVCAHWGGGLPFYNLMPEIRGTLQNSYFDSAASSYLYQPEVFSIAARLVGAEHILFGSDFPLLSPERVMRQVTAQPLTEAEKQAILGDNAQRLLGLSGEADARA